MFVDACAIVSILSGEADAQAFSEVLIQAGEPFTSPMAAWEAVMVLARPEKFGLPLARSHDLVLDWLSARRIAIRHPQSPPEMILRLAVEAADQMGVGRRHLSSLDCFHFAQAKSEGVAMLTSDRLLQESGLETYP